MLVPIKDLYKAIEKDFDIERFGDMPVGNDQQELLDNLKRFLEEKINHLIEHDVDKLLSLLYRIDVSEKKVRAILAAHPHQDAAPLIAELIIERQIQKLISRKKYK